MTAALHGLPPLSTECVNAWCRDCTYAACCCTCHPSIDMRATQDSPARSGVSSRERVYAAVVAHHDCHLYAPTVRELAAATDLAVSTVAYHVDGLVAAGRLARRPGLVRTLVPAPVVAGAA